MLRARFYLYHLLIFVCFGGRPDYDHSYRDPKCARGHQQTGLPPPYLNHRLNTGFYQANETRRMGQITTKNASDTMFMLHQQQQAAIHHENYDYTNRTNAELDVHFEMILGFAPFTEDFAAPESWRLARVRRELARVDYDFVRKIDNPYLCRLLSYGLHEIPKKDVWMSAPNSCVREIFLVASESKHVIQYLQDELVMKHFKDEGACIADKLSNMKASLRLRLLSTPETCKLINVKTVRALSVDDIRKISPICFCELEGLEDEPIQSMSDFRNDILSKIGGRGLHDISLASLTVQQVAQIGSHLGRDDGCNRINLLEIPKKAVEKISPACLRQYLTFEESKSGKNDEDVLRALGNIWQLLPDTILEEMLQEDSSSIRFIAKSDYQYIPATILQKIFDSITGCRYIADNFDLQLNSESIINAACFSSFKPGHLQPYVLSKLHSKLPENILSGVSDTMVSQWELISKNAKSSLRGLAVLEVFGDRFASLMKHLSVDLVREGNEGKDIRDKRHACASVIIFSDIARSHFLLENTPPSCAKHFSFVWDDASVRTAPRLWLRSMDGKGDSWKKEDYSRLLLISDSIRAVDVGQAIHDGKFCDGVSFNMFETLVSKGLLMEMSTKCFNHLRFIKKIKKKHYSKLPVDIFEGMNDSVFNSLRIHEIPTAHFNGIGKESRGRKIVLKADSEKIKHLPATFFSLITGEELKYMPPESCPGITPEQMKQISPSSLRYMSLEQAIKLRTKTLLVMTPQQIHSIGCKRDQNAICAFESHQNNSSLSPEQMAAIKKELSRRARYVRWYHLVAGVGLLLLITLPLLYFKIKKRKKIQRRS